MCTIISLSNLSHSCIAYQAPIFLYIDKDFSGECKFIAKELRLRGDEAQEPKTDRNTFAGNLRMRVPSLRVLLTGTLNLLKLVFYLLSL